MKSNFIPAPPRSLWLCIYLYFRFDINWPIFERFIAFSLLTPGAWALPGLGPWPMFPCPGP